MVTFFKTARMPFVLKTMYIESYKNSYGIQTFSNINFLKILFLYREKYVLTTKLFDYYPNKIIENDKKISIQRLHIYYRIDHFLILDPTFQIKVTFPFLNIHSIFV